MESLIAWRERGVWPDHHYAMTCAATVCIDGNGVLDLGCGHGLLGAAVGKNLGDVPVVGIDADEALLQEAEQAGVGQRFYRLEVTQETLPDLQKIIDFEGVAALLAWRVIPDIWGHHRYGGLLFAKAIADAGIKEVLIEGGSQVVGSRIRNIDDEVLIMSGFYREVARYGQISYMRIK